MQLGMHGGDVIAVRHLERPSQQPPTSQLTDRQFKISLQNAKRSVHRAANTMFVICVELPLIKSKCVPAPLHGLEECRRTNSDIRSLDIVISRFLSEIFPNYR